MGWEYNSHIVCMCIIMRWSRNFSANWAERFRTSSLLGTYKLCNYYTPSLLYFLHHPYMWPFSICKIFHLLVYKALLCFVIGMAKVLPIIDVLGYDGQNSSFSSPPPPPPPPPPSPSDSTLITQKGSHTST